ncbi:hypothetical protein BDA96_08G136800 [Sorghum bicolor]|uniref:Uncharacterized protein n=1 Tax=Sorghum bicolor TaxID=4558 RepID=A0A921QI01_SORBI|nr:hypothetical protein BDA96_08G136800 [Sorghum bicolor]
MAATGGILPTLVLHRLPTGCACAPLPPPRVATADAAAPPPIPAAMAADLLDPAAAAPGGTGRPGDGDGRWGGLVELAVASTVRPSHGRLTGAREDGKGRARQSWRRWQHLRKGKTVAATNPSSP